MMRYSFNNEGGEVENIKTIYGSIPSLRNKQINNNNIYNNLNEIYIHNGTNIVNNNTNINTLRKSQSVSTNISNNNHLLCNQYNQNNKIHHHPLNMPHQVNNVYQVHNCNYSSNNNVKLLNHNYTITPGVARSPYSTLQRNYNNKPSSYEINVSYNTFELTKEQKKRNKQLYKTELLSQIKEKQMKHFLEEQNRLKEDKKDEERIRIQNIELQKSFEEEREIKKNDPTDKFNIKYSYNKKRIIYNNDNVIDDDLDEDGLPRNLPLEEKTKILKEREEQRKVQNELMILTKQFHEQNDQFINKINDLQKETKDANSKRFTDLIEIEKIKANLDQQREDERIRKKNMFDNLIYGGDNLSNIISNKLQCNDIINNSLLNSNEYLLSKIYTQNINQRYLPLSSLNLFEKHKEESKEYVSNLKLNERSEINKSNDNHNNIKTPQQQQHEKTESKIQNDDNNNLNHKNNNKNKLDTLTHSVLEIDQIYNKNLTRLKILNNIENQMVSKYKS